MFNLKLTKSNKKLLKITFILLILEIGIGVILYYFSDILFPKYHRIYLNSDKESFNDGSNTNTQSNNNKEFELDSYKKIDSEEKPRGKLSLHYCQEFETQEECEHKHSNGTKHGCVYDKPSGKCFSFSDVV